MKFVAYRYSRPDSPRYCLERAAYPQGTRHLIPHPMSFCCTSTFLPRHSRESGPGLCLRAVDARTAWRILVAYRGPRPERLEGLVRCHVKFWYSGALFCGVVLCFVARRYLCPGRLVDGSRRIWLMIRLVGAFVACRPSCPEPRDAWEFAVGSMLYKCSCVILERSFVACRRSCPERLVCCPEILVLLRVVLCDVKRLGVFCRENSGISFHVPRTVVLYPAQRISIT